MEDILEGKVKKMKQNNSRAQNKMVETTGDWFQLTFTKAAKVAADKDSVIFSVKSAYSDVIIYNALKEKKGAWDGQICKFHFDDKREIEEICIRYYECTDDDNNDDGNDSKNIPKWKRRLLTE